MITTAKKISFGAASIALVVSAFGATAAADTQPGANPVQSKYMTRSGVAGSMCEPTGALKELIRGKYKCYGPNGGDACGASIDAAKGKLDTKYNDLFVDLMKTDPSLKTNKGDGYMYAAGCSDLGGADFAHMLSASGLSYAKANPEVLLAQGTAANFSKWSGAQREDYVAAIGRYGEAQKDKIIPILKIALATSGQMLAFKKNALKILARFQSDEGVAYCNDVLKQGNDTDLTATCGYYFGERKNVAAVPTLIRRIDDQRDTFTRSLGLIGSKDAVAPLKDEYEKRAGSNVALKTTIALMNLGDKSYDYGTDLVAMIQGRRPLSLSDRQRKAKDLSSKQKGAAARWKTREQEESEDMARDAALEATYVLGNAKVDTALRATAKRSDWPRASAMATSALAQRGDKAATADLIKLLGSSKEEVRDIAVGAFGATYDTPEAFLNYVGHKGVVADPSAVAALGTYIDNEPKEERREKALRAIGAVKSFLK